MKTAIIYRKGMGDKVILFFNLEYNMHDKIFLKQNNLIFYKIIWDP